MRQNLKTPFLLFIFLLLSFSLFSQNSLEPKYPELFKTIPSYNRNLLEWQKLLYSSNPNYFQIIKSYEKFYLNNPFEKNIHTQNYKYFLKNVNDLKFEIDDSGFLIRTTKKVSSRLFDKTGKVEESNNTWLQYGPNNIYTQEKPNNSKSYQANVYSVYKSNKGGVIFAMTEVSGIFVSINSGVDWKNVTPNDKSNITTKYHAEPIVTIDDETNRLYFTFQGDIYYSDNLGESWLKIPLNEQRITKMKVINSILYYSSDSGLHKIDNGKKTLIAGFIWDFLVFPKNDIIYATKYNSIKNITEFYVSKDFGLSFSLKNNGWWNPINGKAATSNIHDSGVKIASAESNPNIVYATILGEEDDNIDDKNFIGIFKSINGGDTWFNLNPSGETGGPYSAINPCHVCSGDNGYFQGWFAFDFEMLNNSNTILLGGIILKLSIDGGITWTKPVIDHVDIQDIFVFDDSELYIASDGGINKYSIEVNNITNIGAINSGIHDSDFWGFGLGTNEISMVGGRYHNGDAYHKSTYGFGNFNKVSGTEEGTGYVNKGDNSVIATFHGGVKKMADKIEEKPIILSNNLEVKPNEGYVFNSRSDFETHPLYFNEVYFGSKNSIYKSLNFGGDSSLLFQFGTLENNLITDVRISPEDSKLIYAVQRIGYTDSKLWRSKNSGGNWEELNIPLRNQQTASISINVEGRLFLSTNGSSEIFISDNQGDSWVLFATLPNNIKPFNIRTIKGNNNIIFLAHTYENSNVNDLFIVDDSSNLTHITSSLKNYIWIRDFEIYYPDKKIFISGAGGIWQSDLNVNLDESVNPMVSQRKITKGEEITFSVNTNIEKIKIKSYRWKIGNQFIDSDNYNITLNSSLIEGAGLLDLSVNIIKTDGQVLSSKIYENSVEIVAKIIPELFLGIDTLKFSGAPSALNITNCKVLPLIKDNSGNVLSALDLETETLFLTHESFLNDENIIAFDNEIFIGNFIKKSNQKILVITTSWAETSYKSLNKFYSYLASKEHIISFDFKNGDGLDLNNFDVIIADIQSSPLPETVVNLKNFIKNPNKKSILIGIGWVWTHYFSSWANENPKIYPMNIISQDLGIQFDLNIYGNGEPLGMKFYPYTLTNIDDLSLSCLDNNRNGISDKTEDEDVDGVNNYLDRCINTSAGESVDAIGCSDSQLDEDGDGIMNDKDLCPVTPEGSIIDVHGCVLFTLPSSNYSVKNISNTCIGSNNGALSISVENKDFTYALEIPELATNYDLSNSNSHRLTISNLGVGVYTLKFTITGEASYSQIFESKIGEPQPLQAKAVYDVSGKIASFILEGSQIYFLEINGEIKEVSDKYYSIPLKPGFNKIRISTPLECQGVYEEEIFVSEDLIYYPNPVNDVFNIQVPGKDKKVIVDVYNESGAKVLSSELKIGFSRTVQVYTSKLSSGIYIVNVKGKTASKNFKIIKN
jgi:hypothetical protein